MVSIKTINALGRQLQLSRSCSASLSTQRLALPLSVRVVEVGLRDGLQNEKQLVTTETKLQVLQGLYDAGLRSIESGSFVSPKWVPQMKDTPEIFQFLRDHRIQFPGASFSALTPNAKGRYYPPRQSHLRVDSTSECI
jgi:hypothetical protein